MSFARAPHPCSRAQVQFKAVLGDDGSMEIRVDGPAMAPPSGPNKAAPAKGEEEVEAEEILTALQMASFLKFSQGRPEERLPLLFTEKLASVLNFHRLHHRDCIEQLGTPPPPNPPPLLCLSDCLAFLISLSLSLPSTIYLQYYTRLFL